MNEPTPHTRFHLGWRLLIALTGIALVVLPYAVILLGGQWQASAASALAPFGGAYLIVVAAVINEVDGVLELGRVKIPIPRLKPPAPVPSPTEEGAGESQEEAIPTSERAPTRSRGLPTLGSGPSGVVGRSKTPAPG